MLGIQVLCGVWEEEESEMLMVSDHVKQWPHRCVNLSPSSLPRLNFLAAVSGPLGCRTQTFLPEALLPLPDTLWEHLAGPSTLGANGQQVPTLQKQKPGETLSLGSLCFQPSDKSIPKVRGIQAWLLSWNERKKWHHKQKADVQMSISNGIVLRNLQRISSTLQTGILAIGLDW